VNIYPCAKFHCNKKYDVLSNSESVQCNFFIHVNLIHRSEDIAVWIFRIFGLKCLFRPPPPNVGELTESVTDTHTHTYTHTCKFIFCPCTRSIGQTISLRGAYPQICEILRFCDFLLVVLSCHVLVIFFLAPRSNAWTDFNRLWLKSLPNDVPFGSLDDDPQF